MLKRNDFEYNLTHRRFISSETVLLYIYSTNSKKSILSEVIKVFKTMNF